MSKLPKTVRDYRLHGAFLGFAIQDSYTTLAAAKTRLDELAACGNDVAESDPFYRAKRSNRYVPTEAPLPELMDIYTGQTLVSIAEGLTFEPRA